MRADFTRDTYSPLERYTRVLMQQGRVQLDADWNEQTSILLHQLQEIARDLPGPANASNAFNIEALKSGPGAKLIANDFLIGAGRVYVDGILCELLSVPIPITGFPGATQIKVKAWPIYDLAFRQDQYVRIADRQAKPALSPVWARITDLNPQDRVITLDSDVSAFNNPKVLDPVVFPVTTYLTQLDFPASSDDLKNGTVYLVYLDVWERLITYIEDDHIREVALGGPDTAVRGKQVCQVRVEAGSVGFVSDTEGICDAFKPDDKDFTARQLRDNHGLLKARAKQAAAATDPCITPPDASYTGPENQLYRVEVHKSGPVGTATFKWSRENGCVVFAIASGGGTNVVTLESLGRDDRFGLTEGDWVEVVDDDYILLGRAGNLLQVQLIDRTGFTVTLTGTPDATVGKDPSLHPLLRRWDQKPGDPGQGGLKLGPGGTALIPEDSSAWFDLENGVQIQFEPPDSGQPGNYYRTGDYWLIPARTATGDVEWPKASGKDAKGNPIQAIVALPPAGIEHHYLRLGILDIGPDGQAQTFKPCKATLGRLGPIEINPAVQADKTAAQAQPAPPAPAAKP